MIEAYKKSITLLCSLIILLAALATSFGIFSSEVVDVGIFRSVHGQDIELYGVGLYKYMSADVAIQGIAQDYVTLFIAIPILIFALVKYRSGSLKGLFLLSGVLSYFLVTYLFYTAMGMYNEMFLVYIALLGSSFFALLMVLFSFDLEVLEDHFEYNSKTKSAALFLIVNAFLITLLWCSVVLPPLFDGSIYPRELQHYTTLIVQGFDLGLLLPLAFVSATLLLKRRKLGSIATTTYMGFLSILMTALSAKLIAMMNADVNVIPAIFIIPTINIMSIVIAAVLFTNIKELHPS